VIQGLRLLAFEAGDVILSQGERGDSLYMLAAGRVKVFVRGADGKQAAVGELSEGAFFGEISILTGRPRSATIVAASRCELLELDRATLDAITRDHPRVWDVMREFAARRARRS
jgi:cAMP-dependent protein kinase regulator